jgi:hypothetical protein
MNSEELHNGLIDQRLHINEDKICVSLRIWFFDDLERFVFVYRLLKVRNEDNFIQIQKNNQKNLEDLFDGML